MDGTALIGGNGESGLFDHGPQGPLLDGYGKIIFHHGQIGVIRGGQAQDIEIRVAAAQMDHLPFISGEGDHIVWHPADDVAEQPGVQDQLAPRR